MGAWRTDNYGHMYYEVPLADICPNFERAREAARSMAQYLTNVHPDRIVSLNFFDVGYERTAWNNETKRLESMMIGGADEKCRISLFKAAKHKSTLRT